MDPKKDVFEFETAGMALKGNPDYAKLLQHLNHLTALRSKAILDIDKVLELEDKAMADPLEFLRKVKNGEDLGIPERVQIPEMPVIDWAKYKGVPAMDALRPVTRPKIRDIKIKSEHDNVVRGRVKEKEKPETFNQPWTAEEQLKLDQLLVKYPPETNEARRFAKIAEELGNRTLAQVTSRCQKYFIKLHQAGLPVPGRPPRQRSKEFMKTKSKYTNTKHQSSFFPRSVPHISFRDDGDLPGTSPVQLTMIKPEPMDMDEEEIFVDSSSNGSRASSVNGSTNSNSLKLALLRRVRADLSRNGDKPLSHPGFLCNVCKEEPLQGTRWHCMQCEDLDFCSSCLIGQLELETDSSHPLDHLMSPFRSVRISSTTDKDYALDSAQYHYLDTGFRPE